MKRFCKATATNDYYIFMSVGLSVRMKQIDIHGI